MAKKTESCRGSTGFDHHFSTIYGPRWPGLKKALEDPRSPEPLLDGLVKAYYLDRASVRAAQALEVEPGHEVLDLCAAPGGKTLVLALRLQGTGRLVSNDRSPDRRNRLKRVIAEHVPPEWQGSISVTGHDASRWGLYEQARYDRVLLDAPCSSERHLVHSPGHLAQWSPNRTKILAQQALAMLCAALEALKPGGLLVYSTCSISPLENEGTLDRFAEKRPGLWSRLESHLVLPDETGEGPLFWAKIQKKA